MAILLAWAGRCGHATPLGILAAMAVAKLIMRSRRVHLISQMGVGTAIRTISNDVGPLAANFPRPV
jgi:hypothetical protein